MSDLGMKGIVFHLGISAFSLTFSLQDQVQPGGAIIMGNFLITALALVCTVAIAEDGNRARKRLIHWHNQLDHQLDPQELGGVVLAGRLYVGLCVVPLIFWGGVFFFPPS